ncbi:hypothetical protein F8M41_005736 [Gigaspora margarita]|uniref:Uncharacterized protein n=1 Tax=Gigaspora margarita TaxID=4874 RepID=A0A8H4A4D7_GIGMA|nr:hypothetical protein F8M41_005736 [Gigaspora margarita]
MSNDIHSPEISDPGEEKDEKGRISGHSAELQSSRQRSHMMRVAQPDSVPDWTAGGENEESDYSEEEDEEDKEDDDDDDNENEDEDSNEKRGSGGGNGNDKRSGKRLAIDVIEKRPNK